MDIAIRGATIPVLGALKTRTVLETLLPVLGFGTAAALSAFLG